MASSGKPSKERTAATLSVINETAKLYSEDAPGARERLVALSYELAANLELPSETVSRIAWTEPGRYIGCYMGIDLNVFNILAEKEGQSCSVIELAERTGAEPAFLARFLKHLAATHVVHETDANQYCATEFSNSLTQPALGNGLKFLHDVLNPSFQGMPLHFAAKGYQNPPSASEGPFQWAHKTDLTFFEWMKERPSKFQAFNQYMTGYRSGKKSFVESYDFDERIISGFDSSEQTLLVDVGGGMGQDLLDIRAKFSDLPGELVLQDLPNVISQVPPSRSDGKFRPTTHDFFGTQPIKNARAYYLHSILHDWDDEACQEILKQLAQAMKPGYSRLLINELVATDIRTSWEITSMDLAMLSVTNARERTEKEWRKMMADAGLEVTDIVPGHKEGIIEAELV